MTRSGTGRRPGVGDDELRLVLAAAGARAGRPVDPAGLPGRVQRGLHLAHALGAPSGPALEAALAAADDELARDRAVRRAAAEGRSVARALVALPPLLGPGVALLVTDAPFAVWRTGPGRVVLAVAVALWALGAALVRVAVRHASAVPAVDGPDDELLDLVASALAAGAGLPQAVRLAAATRGGDGATGGGAVASWLELGGPGPAPDPWGRLGPVLRAAARDGLPLAPVARELAARQRAAAQQAALERAERLGARLTVPTTLLLLPAAMLVAGAPLVATAFGLVG